VAAYALRQADQAMYAAKQARVRPTSAL